MKQEKISPKTLSKKNAIHLSVLEQANRNQNSKNSRSSFPYTPASIIINNAIILFPNIASLRKGSEWGRGELKLSSLDSSQVNYSLEQNMQNKLESKN